MEFEHGLPVSNPESTDSEAERKKRKKKKSIETVAQSKPADEKEKSKSLRESWEEILVKRKEKTDEDAPEKKADNPVSTPDIEPHHETDRKKKKRRRRSGRKPTEEALETTEDERDERETADEAIVIPLEEEFEEVIELHPASGEPTEIISHFEEKDVFVNMHEKDGTKTVEVSNISQSEVTQIEYGYPRKSDSQSRRSAVSEQAKEPIQRPTSEFEIMASQASQTLPEQETTDQVLAEPTPEAREHIDPNLDISDDGGAGELIPSSPITSQEKPQSSALEPTFLEGWRQRQTVDRLKKEQKLEHNMVEDLEKDRRKTRRELERTNREKQANIDYWRTAVASQPAISIAEKPPETREGASIASASKIARSELPDEAQDIVDRLHGTGRELQRSAWHSIEIDKKTGHAAEQPVAIEYGREFFHEKQKEALQSEPEPEEVATASGQLAVSTSAGFQLPQAVVPLMPQTDNVQIPKSRSSPINAIENTVQLSRHVLTGDLWLWVMLCLVITAIVVSIEW